MRKLILGIAALSLAVIAIGCSSGEYQPEIRWEGLTPKNSEDAENRYWWATCSHGELIKDGDQKMDDQTHPGDEITFTWPSEVPCPYCQANGACAACTEHGMVDADPPGKCPVCYQGIPVVKCATCDGEGVTIVPGQTIVGQVEITREDLQTTACRDCGGSGRRLVVNELCTNCSGSGLCPVCKGDDNNNDGKPDCDFCEGAGTVSLQDKLDSYGKDSLFTRAAFGGAAPADDGMDEGGEEGAEEGADGAGEMGAEEGSEEGSE